MRFRELLGIAASVRADRAARRLGRGRYFQMVKPKRRLKVNVTPRQKRGARAESGWRERVRLMKEALEDAQKRGDRHWAELKTYTDITQEKIVELYEFLQGKIPDGTSVSHPPRLTEEQAFAAIWFLQEHMGVLPDKFEQCCACRVIYNSEAEGLFLDVGEDGRVMADGKPIPKKYIGGYCSDECCPVDWKWKGGG